MESSICVAVITFLPAAVVSLMILFWMIGLKVEEVQGDTEIVCTVMNDGPISNHKGVNVPGVKLNLPFFDDLFQVLNTLQALDLGDDLDLGVVLL